MIQARARHSWAPACRGLGSGGWFFGKDANNQVHSCLDGERARGLAWREEKGQGASSRVQLYLLSPQGAES